MEKGETLASAVVLGALYARGAPRRTRLVRKRWGLVRDALCRSLPSLSQAGECLREAGLWDEAATLSDSDLLDWALRNAEDGRLLTVVDRDYPARWLSVLGAHAPPSIWVTGRWPGADSVSVVGSRHIDADDREFARDVGSAVIQMGMSLVTGGAIGSDTASINGALEAGGAGRIVVLLPYGLEGASHQRTLSHEIVWASVAEPTAGFTAPQAMERNTLIFAASNTSVVVHARYKEGGSWHGAVGAIRERHSNVCVRSDESNKASSVLVKLGAVPIRSAEDIKLTTTLKEPSGLTESPNSR
ncbi:MAG: DNA-processing protein DprA [Armatimonadetes bacterium]|nr:DNA-processing protein DprA [Armatimonadota bacterium]